MPSRSSLLCRNCDAALGRGDRFCGNCGQQAVAARLTVHEISHDLLHALVHVDRSVVSLVRMLLVRPGSVAREYVSGRRKRYFGPFALLVIVVGLASAIVAFSGFHAFSTNNANAVADFLQRHVNVVILIQVPLLAAFCRLIFPRESANFAECLVLAAYTSSMRALFLTVGVVPCAYVFRLSNTAVLNLYYVYLFIWLAYFGLSTSQFYVGRRGVSWLKGALAAALTQAATQGIVSLITYGYSYFIERS